MRIFRLHATRGRLAILYNEFHIPTGLSAACGAARFQRYGMGQGHSQFLPSLSTTILQHRSLTTFNDSSTIYALASAPGRAAIAIIRISGPACLEVGTSTALLWVS